MEKDSFVKDINVEFPLFGKKIEIRLYNSNPLLVEHVIFEFKKKAIELENIFNFFDNKSELSLLNTKRKLRVSKHLLVVIKKALELAKLTHGSYDITFGKKFLARKLKKELPILKCSYPNIKIKGNLVSLDHQDAVIDLGSIAKGYITDQLIDFLKENGISSGLINSRGDIRNFGETCEKIYIQDPRNKAKTICSFVLDNSAVATSGDYNQYDADYNQSHIIGSREIISLTVVSNNLMEADGIATALFVCSKVDAKKIIKKYSRVRIFGILKDKTYFKYNWFKK